MAMTRGSEAAFDEIPVDEFIGESHSRHVQPILQRIFGDVAREDRGGRAGTNEPALEGDSSVLIPRQFLCCESNQHHRSPRAKAVLGARCQRRVAMVYGSTIL